MEPRSVKPLIRQSMLAALCVLVLLPTRLSAAEPAIAAQVLAERRVDVTSQGVCMLFDSLSPVEDSQALAARLIRELGDDHFVVREAATARLAALPQPPILLLEAAAEGPDAEVRIRAKRILKRLDRHAESAELLIFAGLLTLRDELPPGQTADILRIAPLCQSAVLRRAACEALQRTAQVEDVSRLRAALSSDTEIERAVALAGILALTPDASNAEWEKSIAAPGPGEFVRQVAAQHLARRGETSGVRLLVEQLASKDAAVRSEAARLLGELIELDPESAAELRDIADGVDEKKLPMADERDAAREKWESLLDARLLPADRRLNSRVGWSEFLRTFVVRGEYDGQATEFVKDVPATLRKVLKHEERVANTINSVDSRHGTAPWLYPMRGKNEAPRILVENGQRLFPFWGTWRQRWGPTWTPLDESGKAVDEDSRSGPHIESRVEFLVVPIAP